MAVNLKELFWSGGGMVLVLLSLIEVSPIKINPWSRLAKIIGHALNAEVLEQQKQTQKKLEEHIQVDDERNANLLRTQILRFNDELIDDKHHTREHFIEILAVIDAYEDYCRSHPDYKNIGLIVPANFLYYAVHVNRLPARQPSPPTTP